MFKPDDVSMLEVVLIGVGVLSVIVVVFLAALAYYRRQEQKKE